VSVVEINVSISLLFVTTQPGQQIMIFKTLRRHSHQLFSVADLLVIDSKIINCARTCAFYYIFSSEI